MRRCIESEGISKSGAALWVGLGDIRCTEREPRMSAESTTVTFRTLDGLNLAGTLVTPAKPASRAIVLVHAGGVTREEGGFFTRLAASLGDAPGGGCLGSGRVRETPRLLGAARRKAKSSPRLGEEFS